MLEHVCLSASALASFVLSPFSGLITRLTCPALARTSAQLAGFSLLIPVFIDWQPSLSSLCDWITTTASLC